MEKHPCLECRQMPNGQDMSVEPCGSCQEPENYCNRLGPAGIGSVPYRISDYQPRKENAMVTTPAPPDSDLETETLTPEMFTCKVCETPKQRTTENFAPHARTKDGLHTTCRDCIRKLIDEGRKKRKSSSPSKMKAKPAPGPAARGKQSPEHDGIKRELNFNGHEDLLRAIEKDAVSQFREFNAHVLFILKRHVDQRNAGKVQ